MSSRAPRFISEKDIEEKKARDAAEGKIEEPYDPRPLYDRLQTERARKQEEYESQKAFKNQIHRLDDDEVAFLAEKDLEKCRNEESAEEEARKLIQEAKEANRSAVLKTSALPVKLQINRPSLPPSSNLSQKVLLAGIKRKPPSSPPNMQSKKPHMELDDDGKLQLIDASDSVGTPSSNPQTSDSSEERAHENSVSTGPARILAGVLPGLDAYENSSDEDSDGSSSDVENAALTFSSLVESRRNKNRRESCE